jgi:hypothetical protein
MNYTDKEIEIIKRKALDKGRREGALIALVVQVVAAILMLA